MTELVAALVAGAIIIVGIVGTVVPVLPGSLLVGAGVLVYALLVQQPLAWVCLAVVLLVLLIGTVAKYLVPARTVSGDVDRLPLIVGGVAGVVGFFVIPIVGLPVGFILGVLGTELVRTRHWRRAWTSTRHAIKAAGLSLLIELAAVVIAGCVWLATILVLAAT